MTDAPHPRDRRALHEHATPGPARTTDSCTSSECGQTGTVLAAARRVYAELCARAENAAWEGIDGLAAEHELLLRRLLAGAHPDAETLAYLESVRADHGRILALAVASRDALREDIKLCATGRKAIAAYR